MAPFTFTPSSAYVPALPHFKYPSLLSVKKITPQRLNAFQRFLDMPNQGFIENPDGKRRITFLQDYENMAKGLRIIIAKSPVEPDIKFSALRAVDVFEEIYPVDIKHRRDDGTFTRTHPLAIAWWMAYAGAPLDVVIECLYHDAIEHGKFKTKEEFLGKLKIPLNSPSGDFLQAVWWKMKKLTHPDAHKDTSTLQTISEELRSHLKSHHDLSKPEVKELLRLAMLDQNDYILKVYRAIGPSENESQGVMVALTKALDARHNTRSLVHLDPKKHFKRYYITILKAFSHLEYLKKINYQLTREILLAIGEALKRLSTHGIGPAQMPDIYGAYWYHLSRQSYDQHKLEKKGVAVCGKRSENDPDRQAYSGTVMSRYGAEAKDIFNMVGTSAAFFPPIEIEAPAFVRTNLWWHYYQNTLRSTVPDITRAIARSFPQNEFHLEPQPSYLPPLLGKEFMIWRVNLPDKLIDLMGQIQGLNPNSWSGASFLFSKASRQYLQFEKDIDRRMRSVYIEAIRGPVISYNLRVFTWWAQRKFYRLFDMMLPHSSMDLPNKNKSQNQ